MVSNGIIEEIHDRRIPGVVASGIGSFSLSVPQGVDDTKAIDFDGSTEVLANTTENTIGIANIWSVNSWVKFDDFVGSQTWVQIRENTGSENRLDFSTNTSTNEADIAVYNSAGTRFKLYHITEAQMNVGNWVMLSVTWDGTTLRVYVDGADASPTITTDDAGTQTDTARRVTIGGFDTVPQRPLNGNIHSTAVWSVVLTVEIFNDIYNDGAGGVVDLRQVQGKYTQTEVDALKHLWRHGFNSGDIGEDLGNGTAIDIGDNAQNITAADIVTDSPI